MPLLDTTLDPWELFVNSVGSKQTKRQYKRKLAYVYHNNYYCPSLEPQPPQKFVPAGL